jgi:hypothetical protein
LSENHELLVETRLRFFSIAQLTQSAFPITHSRLQKVGIVNSQCDKLRILSDSIEIKSFSLSQQKLIILRLHHLHFAAILCLLFPFTVSREFLSLNHLLVCLDRAGVIWAHLYVMIQIPFQYDRGRSDSLLSLQYVYVVRVLLLAQIPTLNLLLTCHQQLQSILLLCVYEHTNDRDTQEENLEGGSELSARDHLSEKKHKVGPREDT